MKTFKYSHSQIKVGTGDCKYNLFKSSLRLSNLVKILAVGSQSHNQAELLDTVSDTWTAIADYPYETDYY